MKKSEITFSITLDHNNIPETLSWQATDSPEGAAPQQVRTVAISIWDHLSQGTMKIDLWTKEMEVPDMKRFVIDSIGGLGESLKTATGDQMMHQQIMALCDSLMDHVKKEGKSA
jgi:gliding motility-associated protein GldC